MRPSSPANVKATHKTPGATASTRAGFGSITKLNTIMTRKENTNIGMTVSLVRISSNTSFRRMASIGTHHAGNLDCNFVDLVEVESLNLLPF